MLTRFGEERAARPGVLAVGLDGGAARMAEVVRALDERGLVVESMELHLPSLDDVFAEATGRRLEGGGADVPSPEEVEGPDAPSAKRRRPGRRR